MEYLRFDPSGFDFPKPLVPVLPSLRLGSLGPDQAAGFRSIRPIQNAAGFVRGRYALHEAFRQAGVGQGDAVLLPAYHCRTMLDPAISLGADVVLYRLNPDLSINPQAIATLLDKHGRRVKALLATHYFGFPQALEELVGLCAKRKVALVEDCAHALFTGTGMSGKQNIARMGEAGEYCIASPAKFFSCEDGGLLWRQGAPVTAPREPEPRGLLNEAKAWIHTAQRALRKIPAPADIVGAIQPSDRENGQPVPAAVPSADKQEISKEPSSAYQPALEGLEILACSRWVMRHTDLALLAKRRRENYRQWAAAVVSLADCHALRPELPDDCVPYMFPLVLHRPHSHFTALKQLGVPIWRWDDMAMSDCNVAAGYRLSLLHLPCHQDLSARQMAWLTNTVASVLQQGPANR